MYYFNARYLPQGGPFISRDPLFEKYFYLSPYAYCANNPVKYVDPTGMEVGDYYTENGQWLGSDGIDDNKAYTATSKKSDGTFNNVSELPISNSELLDRATWVHSESGGSGETITDRYQNAGDANTVSDARVVDYYANAINNAVKKDGSFEKTLAGRMSRNIGGKIVNTSDKYFEGGSGGDSKKFVDARKAGMGELMKLKGATNSISAVIRSVNGKYADPTGGARAWIGQGRAAEYVKNSNQIYTDNGTPSLQFSFSSRKGAFSHSFYKVGK